MTKQDKIIQFIKDNPRCSSSDILVSLQNSISIATLKRILQDLVQKGIVNAEGEKKSRRYLLNDLFQLNMPIDIGKYFENDIDERIINEQFNFSIFDQFLEGLSVFTNAEVEQLNELQTNFETNVSHLTEKEFKKEWERLAIDLSWKSSQIEGNTYSLLETEFLLKEKTTAAGKTRDEATMLLNHKDALDFIMENPDYVIPLSVPRIEDIHRLLIKDLGVDKNIRNARVGISGTNYRPLDNAFQIQEALDLMCKMINQRGNVFEKSLLVLLFISYIQPFQDGNKRTARVISNAILIHHKYCPISFRTVDPIEYKKALLIFYEQQNLYAFKKIYIDQFAFAVKTYF